MPKLRDQLLEVGTFCLGLLHPAQRGQGRHRLSRRHMGAVDIVAGKIGQVTHQLPGAGDESPRRTKCLAEGAHQDRHSGWCHPLRRQGTAPALAVHPKAVGIIEHQPVAASLGQSQQLGTGRLIAIHAEDALADDEASIRLQLAGQMCQIVVSEAVHLGRQHGAGLLQRGVIQPIVPLPVVGFEQRLEHRLIGGKPRRKQ